MTQRGNVVSELTLILFYFGSFYCLLVVNPPLCRITTQRHLRSCNCGRSWTDRRKQGLTSYRKHAKHSLTGYNTYARLGLIHPANVMKLTDSL